MTTNNPQLTRDNEILVKAEGLSKKFCKDLKTSLWYGVKDLASGVTGNKKDRELRPKEFWAVKDINFELRRGECLGLIGHNGAGKSTLLKILNGLINPDAGKVTIKGRVGALIELGAGFNPILSGRENIYNNGAVLGFTRKEIDEKVEEIIDFSEIREFIDMPVRNYSSGMKVRLGFAVAAQMEPDVLIIDEVLAVGDIGFRMKCLTKIGSLLNKTAVIFVSHTMPQISRIANKILLLERGKTLVYSPDISTGIEKYYDSFNDLDQVISGTGEIQLEDFNIFDNENNLLNEKIGTTILNFYKNYTLNLKLKANKTVNRFEVHYSFIDKDSKIVATLYSYLNEKPFNAKGTFNVSADIDKMNLATGVYRVGVAINEVKKEGGNGKVYLFNSNIGSIKIVGIPTGLAPVQFIAKWELK
tara:strand:- start:61631 stop:62878 length:1248 start_codon:yes stop_codon:yes gene_type:complete